jgi:hypothetical protein
VTVGLVIHIHNALIFIKLISVADTLEIHNFRMESHSAEAFVQSHISNDHRENANETSQ